MEQKSGDWKKNNLDVRRHKTEWTKKRTTYGTNDKVLVGFVVRV